MSNKSMWGAFTLDTDIHLPSRILQNQGEELAELTNGAIRGTVLTSSRPDRGGAPLIGVDFYLVVPGMQNYQHLFLTLLHQPPPDIYPLTISDHINDVSLEEIDSREEFEKRLAEQFQTAKVHEVISALAEMGGR